LGKICFYTNVLTTRTGIGMLGASSVKPKEQKKSPAHAGKSSDQQKSFVDESQDVEKTKAGAGIEVPPEEAWGKVKRA